MYTFPLTGLMASKLSPTSDLLIYHYWNNVLTYSNAIPESLENTNTLYFPFKFSLFVPHCRTSCNLFPICLFSLLTHLFYGSFFNRALAFKRILVVLSMWRNYVRCEPWSLKEQAVSSSSGLHSSGGWITHKPQHWPNVAPFLDESLNPLSVLGIHRGASMTKDVTSTELQGITLWI